MSAYVHEGIRASVSRYEGWLEQQLGDELVRSDLARKHDRMRSGAFPFLRATYWRWAETISSIAPSLLDAPVILAIGDTHLENFGTWRDADGRLVWGANDFDDAAVMPYALDLARLAVSALLTGESEPADLVCRTIWDGYLQGLDHPRPVVLEKENRWLREAILMPEKQRAKWWAKFDQPDEKVPIPFQKALIAAMPEPAIRLASFARSAGTGSLGRPRFVAVGEWRGGPVVRECKRLLASAWLVFGEARDGAIVAGEIAAGAFRAVDPHYRVADGLMIRRLSPNSRKIEVDDAGDMLASKNMLRLMAREIACCHSGDPARIAAVRADAAARSRGWLEEAVRAATLAVKADFEDFAASKR